jgi:hypothetical protein
VSAAYPRSVALDPDCPLCEAARITPWYHDDDLCWVAECTICTVPMVVLRDHTRAPDAELKAALHDRLALVVAEHFTFEHWVDDDMRQIPDHYHAHARPVGGFFGHAALRRNGTDAAPTAEGTP